MTDIKTILRTDMVAANVGGTNPYIFYRNGDPDNSEPPDNLRSYSRGVQLDNDIDHDIELDLQRDTQSQGTMDVYECKVVDSSQANAQLIIDEIKRVIRDYEGDSEFSVLEYDEKVIWSGQASRRIGTFFIECNRMGIEY